MIDEYVKNWLIKANRDFIVAERLINLSKDDSYTDAICYHSQQSVEKFLKSFLIYKNIRFPKTHDLDYLLKKCSNIDSTFSTLNVTRLSDYATDVRYPEMLYIPSIDESKKAFDIAKEVRKFVLDKLMTNADELKLF
jgi:HEPN domain-containing protein